MISNPRGSSARAVLTPGGPTQSGEALKEVRVGPAPWLGAQEAGEEWEGGLASLVTKALSQNGSLLGPFQ